MKKILNIGYTNKKKYFENNTFVVEKSWNGFNHLLDYKETQIFDFVPRLIENNEERVVFEKIEGNLLKNPSDKDLKQVAINLRKLHLSDIKLPKNNLRKRIQSYLKIIHSKNLKLDFLEKNWKKIMHLLSKMNKVNPCHNDVWFENLIKTTEEKIYFVDWEYASMGDKHFDLAFYIKSQRLTEKKAQIFLNAYDSVENQRSYDETLIEKYHFLSCYITVCWAYAQDSMPFDVSDLINFLKKSFL